MFTRQKEVQSSPKRKRSLSSSPLPSAVEPSTTVHLGRHEYTNAEIDTPDHNSSQRTSSKRMVISVVNSEQVYTLINYELQDIQTEQSPSKAKVKLSFTMIDICAD